VNKLNKNYFQIKNRYYIKKIQNTNYLALKSPFSLTQIRRLMEKVPSTHVIGQGFNTLEGRR
jgi:hypothetical protein